MASKAYQKLMGQIPKEIQEEVKGNLDLADEIYLALEEQGKKAADLARLMGKSESEISKWLSGTHNFTYKTIRRIEAVLNVKLIMTRSSKIVAYEKRIDKLTKKIEALKSEKEGFEAFGRVIGQFEATLGRTYYRFSIDQIDQIKLKETNPINYHFTQVEVN